MPLAGWDWPPFDILGDTLRGTHQILADMRRRPAKLHEALEVARAGLPDLVQGPVPREPPIPFAWVWVHKSTREFMSNEQFNEFYWPYLRKGILALRGKGRHPGHLLENRASRAGWSFIGDLPKGKVIYHLSNTNPQRARDVLGDTLLSRWQRTQHHAAVRHPPDDVKGYCKKLIDTVGKERRLPSWTPP